MGFCSVNKPIYEHGLEITRLRNAAWYSVGTATCKQKLEGTTRLGIQIVLFPRLSKLV